MTTSLKFATAVFAFTIAGVVLTGAAGAKQVSISGTHSQAEIKATCDRVGGEYVEVGSTYGCEKPDKGTSVYCNDGKCVGYVPDKRAGGGTTPVVPTAEDIFGLSVQR